MFWYDGKAMALTQYSIRFIESALSDGRRDRAAGLRMLELGDQTINDPQLPDKTGKQYFSNRGVEHVSVDLSGLNGSLVRDLGKPNQFRDWHGYFDVVTNSGTSEHVEPLAAQYACFSIIHDCLRVGGVAVHLVPDVNEHDERGAWAGHCPFYYSGAFFERLAAACGYDILRNEVIDGLRCVVVRKTRDNPFMQSADWFCQSIAQRACSHSYHWARLRGLAIRLGLRRPLNALRKAFG